VSNATRAPIYDLKGYRLTWANTSGVNADGTSVGRPVNRRRLLAGSYLWSASFELSTPVSSLPARFNLTNRDQFAAYVEDVLTSASFASRVRQEVAHKRLCTSPLVAAPVDFHHSVWSMRPCVCFMSCRSVRAWVFVFYGLGV
jgi:hypothetical protein